MDAGGSGARTGSASSAGSTGGPPPPRPTLRTTSSTLSATRTVSDAEDGKVRAVAVLSSVEAARIFHHPFTRMAIARNTDRRLSNFMSPVVTAAAADGGPASVRSGSAVGVALSTGPPSSSTRTASGFGGGGVATGGGFALPPPALAGGGVTPATGVVSLPVGRPDGTRAASYFSSPSAGTSDSFSSTFSPPHLTTTVVGVLAVGDPYAVPPGPPPEHPALLAPHSSMGWTGGSGGGYGGGAAPSWNWGGGGGGSGGDGGGGEGKQLERDVTDDATGVSTDEDAPGAEGEGEDDNMTGGGAWTTGGGASAAALFGGSYAAAVNALAAAGGGAGPMVMM